MNYTGLIVPFNLSTAILRVPTDLYPDDLHEFVKSIPLMCVSLQHFYGTWISFWYYMSVSAIVFRFVMVKYSDRGLANDRYYWNMNHALFKANRRT